mmetsp:Transcript_20623/g.49074  ORF Transcript_20623/g.49074 Transcript_20623/m.49074 type:complete len:113 (-) Transcript_20623:70-408(-)
MSAGWNIHWLLGDHSWFLFIIVSIVLTYYVIKDTWLIVIVRDKLNKERQQKLKEYRSLLQKRENLSYHVGWSKADGDYKLSERLAQDLEKVELELDEVHEWLCLKDPSKKAS